MTDRQSDRQTRSTERAATTSPLIEQFQLLGDGIEALLARLTPAPHPA